MGWFTQNAIVFQSYSKAYFKTIIKEEKPQADRLALYIKEYFS
jgi:hypothetical protein